MTIKLRKEETVLAQKGPSLGNWDCKVVQCIYLYVVTSRISAKLPKLGKAGILLFCGSVIVTV